MKSAAIALAAALTFACGASVEDGSDIELESIDQPYIALNSASKQWGARTGGDHLACDKVTSGQVCSFAKFKTIELARPNSWDTGAKQRLDGCRSGLASAYGAAGWTFNVVDSASTPGSNVVRVLYQNAAVSGSLTNNIKNYASVSFVSPTALTEGLNGGTPAGQYQTHGSCIANIDFTDIFNKSANSGEDDRLFDHAFCHAAALCMGVGARTDSANTVARQAINLTSFLPAGTSAEVCRSNYGTNNTTDFSVQTLSACSGD